MRIISQEGRIDLPYENTVINIDYCCRTEIVAFICGLEEKENMCQLAKYSTEKKAVKAMDMLHQQYQEICVGNVMNGNLEYLGKSFGEHATTNTLQEFYKKNIFQFPKDEDVEVED